MYKRSVNKPNKVNQECNSKPQESLLFPLFFMIVISSFFYIIYILISISALDQRRNIHGIVANMLDCNIVVSIFKLWLQYYIHCQTDTLEKAMKLLILLLWVK